MVSRSAAVRGPVRKSRKKRKKRSKLAKLWPNATTRKRWMRHFRRAPGPVRIMTVVLIIGSVWLLTNWIYQVIRKPSELFFPVSGTLFKTPLETWRSYAPVFRRHSTDTIPPELLAALAQEEGSGNPVA